MRDSAPNCVPSSTDAHESVPLTRMTVRLLMSAPSQSAKKPSAVVGSGTTWRRVVQPLLHLTGPAIVVGPLPLSLAYLMAPMLSPSSQARRFVVPKLTAAIDCR